MCEQAFYLCLPFRVPKAVLPTIAVFNGVTVGSRMDHSSCSVHELLHFPDLPWPYIKPSLDLEAIKTVLGTGAIGQMFA